MERKRKGYNWKARQTADVKIDNETQKKIPVELTSFHRGGFDESNPLVLPSKKRKTTKKRNASPVRVLSKKQRKFYEKLLEKKKKKERRALLMHELCTVQNPVNDVLNKLIPTKEVHTRGRKRLLEIEDIKNVHGDSKIVNPIGPAKVKRRFLKKLCYETRADDDNVVGFQTSDSESANNSSSEDASVSENKVVQKSTNSAVSENSPLGDSFESEKEVVQKCASIAETENSISEDAAVSGNEVVQKLAPVAVAHVRDTVEPKLFVVVNRDPLLQRARLKLPIIGEEQTIMEAINENDAVIIAGETGSGKTTQLPQFLYEAGYTLNGKMIGITEPRRVAAISMSQRVARELNLTTREISYLIRFEGNATSETQIKFMTDGVLIKEIQKDFLLSKYSAIIVDEAHERSAFTDILIGLLSRIILLRKKRNNPLKLIIMSATLRISDFTENTKLFKAIPPVIKVDARQFPVTVHFNKKTAFDYMSEAYKKACKIHAQLPEGGILIFLTGQQEVNNLVRKLRKTFPVSKTILATDRREKYDRRMNEYSSDEDDEKVDSEPLTPVGKKTVSHINVEDYAIKPTDEELELSESDDDIEEIDVNYKREVHHPMWVLPLYSLLPSTKQARIFQAPPSGCRLCVVSTNVAETSLTIPNVKYVIDCGRTKMRLYDKLTGVSKFTVTWTSKASADQRAGRAGRTSAGHCYRLYSSAVYNDEFEEWNVPEIRQKSVDDLLLMMKALKIDRVVNFPFPSVPDVLQLKSAERRLTLLGALKPNANIKDEWSSTLTSLGESMAVYPVAPRFAKMLCMSRERDILSYTIAIVAALSVQEVLLQPNDNCRKIWHSWAGMGNAFLLGDVMVLLRALGAAEHATSTEGGVEKFCELCGLRYKAIVEARKLRVQLTNEVNLHTPNLNLMIDPKMLPPSDAQARQLRQILMAGMVDRVACKLSKEELKQAGLSSNKAAYRTADMEDIIFLHSSSVLRKLKPEWIIFQEAYELNDKLYARGITAIEPEWLPVYATSLCSISNPLKDPAPYYNEENGRIMCFISSTFGRSGWQLPVTEVEYPSGEDKFKWFATFLLDGYMFPKLRQNREHLLSPSNTVFKPWAKFLMHRTNNLLKVLMEKEVDSKEKLMKQWQMDPEYLLETYLEWLPESAHKEVKDMWPPV